MLTSRSKLTYEVSEMKRSREIEGERNDLVPGPQWRSSAHRAHAEGDCVGREAVSGAAKLCDLF